MVDSLVFEKCLKVLATNWGLLSETRVVENPFLARSVLTGQSQSV